MHSCCLSPGGSNVPSVADIFNDSKYAELLALAAAGTWDAIMCAPPCTYYAATRWFDASKGDPNKSPGPPPLYDTDYPDGIPLDKLDPRYHREQRLSKILLERVAKILVTARNSPPRVCRPVLLLRKESKFH